MFNFIDRFIRKNSLHLIFFNLMFISAFGMNTSIKHFFTGMNILLLVLLLLLMIGHALKNFCNRTKEAPVYTLNDKLLDAYVFLISLVLTIIESGDLLKWMKENLILVILVGGWFLIYLWDKWDYYKDKIKKD